MSNKDGMTETVSVALTPKERAKLRQLANSMGVAETAYLRVLAQAISFNANGDKHQRLEVVR